MTGPGTRHRKRHDIRNVTHTAEPSDGLGLGDGAEYADGPTAIWSSDWVGAAADDWDDGGLWGNQGSPAATYVFPVSGSDSPSGYHIRVTNDGGSCKMVPASPPAAPGIGDSITWRFYVQSCLGAFGGDGETHPIGWGSNGGSINETVWPVGLTFYHNSSGKWDVGVYINEQTHGAFRYVIGPTIDQFSGDLALDSNVWYRFELTFTRLSSNTWSVDVAIYDEDDVLLRDTDDFDIANFTESHLLSSAVLVATAARLTEIILGHNGVGGGWDPDDDALRVAQVCAVYGTEVGPWPINGEG